MHSNSGHAALADHQHLRSFAHVQAGEVASSVGEGARHVVSGGSHKVALKIEASLEASTACQDCCMACH